MGQFGLQYSKKAQGTLGSLVATPSLLSRVIESQGQDAEIMSTKSALFLAVRMTFTLERFCRLYIQEIVWLHVVPVSKVSDRDPRFTGRTFGGVSKRL